MAEPKRIVRLVFSAAIFIVMEIAALNMLKLNGVTQNFLLSKQKHAIMGGLWRIDNTVSEYFSLKQENADLSLENLRLFKALRLEESDKDRAKLDSMIRDHFSIDGFRYIPASVVKISRNKQHNYLILDQGYEDGVQAQSAIITSKGVVGIVDTVSQHHAYAVSLMNVELNISARLGREGNVGPLSWDGRHTDGAILREIPLKCEFAQGDTVFTSGFSSIFPADIPLGIVGESEIINGATYEIDVTLFQNFNDVRHVIVATNMEKNKIEELEQLMEGI